MSAKGRKTSPVKKAPMKRKAAKGYKLPDPIRNGEVVRDLMKKEWQIGPSIGVGGFGEIYSATDVLDSPKKRASYPYVIKIEPHINGPLFVEMHFYMKVAKSSEIEAWMKTKKLKSLGIPRFLGSGSHEYNDQKYRFVVIDRYGKDLWSLFLENKRLFPHTTVMKIGLQVIDALEYIHSKTYVHGDIKGSNLLLGLQKGTENQVFLVDFGLASHFTEKEFKPDPKKAHNGTIEYTSRDAHLGVPTMRGDMEILGYNMLQWLASKLPWEDDLSDPQRVHQLKIENMDDISGFMKKSFLKSSPPAALVKYFEYVARLKHNVKPDYAYCRKLLEKELEDCKCPVGGKLEFTNKGLGRSIAKKQKKIDSEEDEQETVENHISVKRTRRTNQAKVSKNNVGNFSSDSDSDGFNENQTDKKQLQKQNKAKMPKKIKKKLASNSDESDGEQQGHVNQITKVTRSSKTVPQHQKGHHHLHSSSPQHQKGHHHLHSSIRSTRKAIIFFLQVRSTRKAIIFFLQVRSTRKAILFFLQPNMASSSSLHKRPVKRGLFFQPAVSTKIRQTLSAPYSHPAK
ncbi:hypothetical protein L9F63_012702, partial [Diploptera punctata]